MKRIIVFLLLLLVLYPTQGDYYAVLTVTVKDVYETPIDDARVSVTYVYLRPEDEDIPDQFTVKGAASFDLEASREYILTVTKAGFLPYTEKIELEEDTTITVILEYARKAPILHMNRYTLTPEEVGPGENFELYVTVENEGTDDALNVKVTIAPNQFFSPVQPKTSAYFERLDVGKLISIRVLFAVSGEALSGVYNLAVTISYQDAAGLIYTAQETVGVPILRKILVKLLNVEYPEEVEQGEQFTFSVEVGNIGRFAVNGLYLEIESYMDWEYYSYYIGSLEAGDFDTFESEVVTDIPGEHIFTITVGFIDDFNRGHRQEESFSVLVKEKAEEPPPPQKEEGLWERIIEFIKAFLGLG
jgi:hypothetical protein